MSSYKQYIEYTTKDKDRLDLIAYEFYGDAKNYKPIIEANPFIPIMLSYPSGIALKIPVLEDNELKTTEEVTSPWTT